MKRSFVLLGISLMAVGLLVYLLIRGGEKAKVNRAEMEAKPAVSSPTVAVPKKSEDSFELTEEEFNRLMDQFLDEYTASEEERSDEVGQEGSPIVAEQKAEEKEDQKEEEGKYFEIKGYKFLKVHPVYHRELVEVAEAYDGTLIPVYKGVKTVVPIICTRKIDPQKAAKTIDMYESLLQSDKYTPEQKEKIWEDYLITLKHYEEVMANPEKLKGYSTSEPHGDIIDPVLSYPTWDTQRIREYLIESGIMIPPDE